MALAARFQRNGLRLPGAIPRVSGPNGWLFLQRVPVCRSQSHPRKTGRTRRGLELVKPGGARQKLPRLAVVRVANFATIRLDRARQRGRPGKGSGADQASAADRVTARRGTLESSYRIGPCPADGSSRPGSTQENNTGSYFPEITPGVISLFLLAHSRQELGVVFGLAHLAEHELHGFDG